MVCSGAVVVWLLQQPNQEWSLHIYAQYVKNLGAKKKERENYQMVDSYTYSLFFLFVISCVRAYIGKD